MSELVAPAKTFQQALRAKLQAKFSTYPPNVCLLMDISSSMSGAPIERLRKIAEKFNKVRRFEFSYACQELKAAQPVGDADGGTAMGVAFRHIKDKGITHTVLITDGLPDNKDDALQAAVGLKIDVIYVGPDPAPQFLADLANATGGKYGEASLQSLEIEGKIMGLLPSPQSENSIKL